MLQQSVNQQSTFAELCGFLQFYGQFYKHWVKGQTLNQLAGISAKKSSTRMETRGPAVFSSSIYAKLA